MARSSAGLAWPQLEARRALLFEARRTLSAMASGGAPVDPAAVAPGPELSQAAYRLAVTAIDEALSEVTKAASLSWGQGVAQLGEKAAETFRTLNRVPELRLRGVRARKWAEAKAAGDGR